jgi:hypothetical protein
MVPICISCLDVARTIKNSLINQTFYFHLSIYLFIKFFIFKIKNSCEKKKHYSTPKRTDYSFHTLLITSILTEIVVLFTKLHSEASTHKFDAFVFLPKKVHSGHLNFKTLPLISIITNIVKLLFNLELDFNMCMIQSELGVHDYKSL